MARIATLRSLLVTACLAWEGFASPCLGVELPEYQLKAAFLYNFALFTEWPADTGTTITLCVLDGSPFLTELDEYQGQPVGGRRFAVRRVPDADGTQGCQLAFLPKASPASIARSMRMLATRQRLLTIGDSPEAAQAGAGITMAIKDAHVTFDVNLKSVQDAGLNLSSKLLRLAQHVH